MPTQMPQKLKMPINHCNVPRFKNVLFVSFHKKCISTNINFSESDSKPRHIPSPAESSSDQGQNCLLFDLVFSQKKKTELIFF